MSPKTEKAITRTLQRHPPNSAQAYRPEITNGAAGGLEATGCSLSYTLRQNYNITDDKSTEKFLVLMLFCLEKKHQ